METTYKWRANDWETNIVGECNSSTPAVPHHFVARGADCTNMGLKHCAMAIFVHTASVTARRTGKPTINIRYLQHLETPITSLHRTHYSAPRHAQHAPSVSCRNDNHNYNRGSSLRSCYLTLPCVVRPCRFRKRPW